MEPAMNKLAILMTVAAFTFPAAQAGACELNREATAGQTIANATDQTSGAAQTSEASPTSKPEPTSVAASEESRKVTSEWPPIVLTSSRD
jgi:hypothetical protein